MTEDELEDIERTVNACDGLTEGECRALIAEVRRLRDVENLYLRYSVVDDPHAPATEELAAARHWWMNIGKIDGTKSLGERVPGLHAKVEAARLKGLSLSVTITDDSLNLAGRPIEDEQGATSNIVATWDESQIKPPKSKPPEPR